MRRRTTLAVLAVGGVLTTACADPAVAPVTIRTPVVPRSARILSGNVQVSTPGRPIFIELADVTLVVVPSRDQDKLFSFRLDRITGALTLLGSVSTGDGPVTATRVRGNLVAVANSLSNDLSVVRIEATGRMTETSRVASGGIAPSDVQTMFPDLIVAANRGALTGGGEGVTRFNVDPHGTMTQIGSILPTGPQPPAQLDGNDPHIIAVGRSGLVAVANSKSNDVTLLEVDRSGDMAVAVPSFPVGASPKALAFHGPHLFVGIRAPVFGASEDQIKAYVVGREPSLTPVGTIDAGSFLTDLEAADGRLFAATWSGFSAPRKEILVLDVGLKASPFDPLPPRSSFIIAGDPSFQAIDVLASANVFLVGDSQFQIGVFGFVAVPVQ